VRTRLALITIGLALLIPAGAEASLADEQQQGQNLIAQLQPAPGPAAVCPPTTSITLGST